MLNKFGKFIVFFSISLFAFSACDVGLGEAVDVISPVLEINYPEDGSTIMNTFTMSGSVMDDTYVALMQVKVRSTSDGSEVATYNFLPNVLTSSWGCAINNKTVGADGSEIYEIPDGEYTFTVTALDSSGKSTVKSRVYKIDNTAPVVVIKRPTNDDSFGKTIRLMGDIADSNSLSSLYFTAYKKTADDKLEKITTIRQANVSGVGLDLVIGKKYENPTTDGERKLDEIYRKIYESGLNRAKASSDAETAEIYCVVEVADSAKEYTPPATNIKVAAQGTYEENGFTPYGNLSTCYYIYNVIYDKIYSESYAGGFRLTNSELVSIFSGNSKKSDAAEIKKYLSENAIGTAGALADLKAEKISKFSLNPKNDPYFDVSGYKYDNGYSEISNGGKITVTVYPGRDQIALKPSSIGVSLVLCDENGNSLGTENRVLIYTEDEIAEITDEVAKAAAIEARRNALTSDENVKIVCSIGKLDAKKYYRVVVQGCDIEGNRIDGDVNYGFFVQSVGKPPVINIDNSKTLDLSCTNKAVFKLSGSITNYGENIEFLKYRVSAVDEKNSDVEHRGLLHEILSKAEGKSIPWSVEIPAEWNEAIEEKDENGEVVGETPGKKFVQPSDSLYLYTVEFFAEDSDFNDSTNKIRFHVDNEAPTVGTVSIEPYYSIDSENIATVNGKISIKATISDNYELASTTCALYSDENCSEDKKLYTFPVQSGFVLEFKNLDTKQINVPDGTTVYMKFKPVDSAGNAGSYVHKFIVDQETDKPVMKFSNLKECDKEESIVSLSNYFDNSVNNKILGTVTDDDNVHAVSLYWSKAEGSGWTEPVEFFKAENLDTVSYSVNAVLKKGLNDSSALEEGNYRIFYKIVDKDGKESGDSIVKDNFDGAESFMIGMDYATPSVVLNTPSGEFKAENIVFDIAGYVYESNRRVSLEATGSSSSDGKKESISLPLGSGWTKNEKAGSQYLGYYEKPGSNWLVKNDPETSGKYHFIFKRKSGGIGDTITIKATDFYAKEMSAALSYKVDRISPTVSVSNDTKTVYLGSNLVRTQSFSGTAEDPMEVPDGNGGVIKSDSSGVKTILYAVKPEGESFAGTDQWKPATGTASWNTIIDFDKKASGIYKVYFKAVDNSGNETKEAEYQARTVVYDTDLPNLSPLIVKIRDREILAQEKVYYVKEKYTVSGSVTDTNFSKLTATGVEGTVTVGADKKFSQEFDAGGTMTFTAYDMAGQTSSMSVDVVLDKVSPSVTVNIEKLLSATEEEKARNDVVNGVVYVSGSITDNNFVVSRKFAIKKNGSEEAEKIKKDAETNLFRKVRAGETDGRTEIEISEEELRNSIKIDSTSFENGLYSIIVTGSDRAGNKGTGEKTIYVDQETDKPEISFSNMVLNGKKGAKDNLFGLGSTVIYGSASDDDGIKLISYKIKRNENLESGATLAAEGICYSKGEQESASTTKDFSIDLAKEKQFVSGEYKVTVTVTDINDEKTTFVSAQENSTQDVPFMYDVQIPVIKALTITKTDGTSDIYTENMFAPKSFTIVGSASDDFKVEKITCEYEKPGDVVLQQAEKNYNWSHKIENLSEGENTFKYVVTDGAGRNANISVVVNVDTTAPVFKTFGKDNLTAHETENTKLKVSGGSKVFNDDSKSEWFIGKTEAGENNEDKPVNWFSTTSITLNGKIEDKNYEKVELYVAGKTEPAGIIQSADFSFTNTFKVGAQTFSIKAYDKAGNTATLGQYSIYIDAEKPVVTIDDANFTVVGKAYKYSEIKNESGADEKYYSINEPGKNLSEILKNGGNVSNDDVFFEKYEDSKQFTVTSASVLQKNMVVKCSVKVLDFKTGSEQTSGVRTVYAGTYGGFESAKAIVARTLPYGTATETEYVIDDFFIPLLSDIDGAISIYVRAVDVAGNSSAEQSIFKCTVDSTAPIVKITSPAKNSIVNKIVELKGSVSEANLPDGAVPVLWYTEGENSGDSADWKKATITDAKIENGIWSLKVDTDVAEINNTTESKKFTFAVTITDIAGNENDFKSGNNEKPEIVSLEVDQDSDRPVITFNNVSLSKMAPENRIWVRTSTIYGNVTDDDVIESVLYSVDGINYTDKNKDGSKIFENGVWQINLEDGEQTIYFKVVETKESGGKEFVSSTNSPGKIDLNAPKIRDAKSNQYGYRKESGDNTTENNYNTVIYTVFDTNKPGFEYYYFAPANMDVSSLDLESATTTIAPDGWKSLNQISVEKFGGPESKFYVWVKASDANGVKELGVTLGDVSYNNVKKIKYLEVPPVTSEPKQKGYYIGLFEVSTNTESFKISGSNINLELKAKDPANGLSTERKSVQIDNTAPVLKIDSHKNGALVFGSLPVTVTGTMEDDNDLKELFYTVTTTSEKPNESAFAKFNGQNVSDFATLNSWNISFDGANNGEGKVRDNAYHDKLLNDYLKDSLGNNWTKDYDKITDMYFWYYGIDEFGNKSEIKSVQLKNSPQADKPTIEITYPTVDSNNVETLGGTIRITGITKISASDVESVWIQIDPTYDGSFNENNWQSEMDAIIKTKGVAALGYEITTETIKEKDENGHEINNGRSVTVTGIKVNGTSYWNKAINLAGELQSQNQNGNYWPVGIRAFAVSKTAKISDYGNVYFNINPDNPLIGNTEELRLVQNIGGVERSQKYAGGMWISGNWYLKGSVEDKTGIRTITVNKFEGGVITESETIVENNKIKTGSSSLFDTEYSSIVSKTEASDEWIGYRLNLPVGSSTNEDCGEISYKIVATTIADTGNTGESVISLNYDNKAPDFKADLLETEINEVIQSNYTYTLNGTFDETLEGGSQSGFERIAMFFTRTLNETTYVIDPMVNMGVNGTSNRTKSTDFAGGNIGSDGLYWTFATTTDAVTTTTINVDYVPSNARKGGLCKVNDVVYLIDNVENNSVILKSKPTAVSSGVTVYFATAQVIDNTVSETGITTPLNASGIGASITNDDGDYMVEEVKRSGAKYFWSASIDSSNIYDGPIEIHFVAFDKAGNSSKKSYSGIIKNNAPRIARVTYGSDEDGDDKVLETELSHKTILYKYDDTRNSKVLYGYDESKRPVDRIQIGSKSDSKLTIKGALKIIPEIVGGNGGLGYSYTLDDVPQKILKYNKDGNPYYENGKSANGVAVELIHDFNVGNGTYGAIRNPAYSDVQSVESNSVKLADNALAINIPVLEYLVNQDLNNNSSGKAISNEEIHELKFKIYDKTECEEHAELGSKNSQTAEISLFAKIVIKSESTPTIHINPFHWNSANDNSLYQNSAKNGHIELEDDWKNASGYNESDTKGIYDGDPKTSGIIVIDGEAFDEVLLKKLEITIDGFNTANTTGGETASPLVFAERKDNGYWSEQAYNEETGWGWILVKDEKDPVKGNTVTWKFIFNTAKIKGVAAADVKVDATATNRGPLSVSYGNVPQVGNTAKSSVKQDEMTSKDALTSHYRMDVVPYITGLNTKLSSIEKKNASVYGRTALGKYPVYFYTKDAAGTANQSEEIGIEGFNIASGAMVYYNGSSSISHGTLDSDLKFTLNSNAISGAMYIKVNGIENLNNKNNTDSKGSFVDISNPESLYENYKHYYNRKANGINNDNLDDNIELAIWGINSQSATSPVGLITEPTMHINPVTGQLGFSFSSGNYGYYPNGVDKKGTNSEEKSLQFWCRDYTPVNTMRFIYDNAGHMFGVHAGTDTNFPRNARFRLVSSVWGPSSTIDGDDSDWLCAYSARYALRLEYMGLYKSSDGTVVLNGTRFQNHPQLAAYTNGTTTNLYLMYYDSLTNELRFRAGKMNNAKEFENIPKDIDSTFRQNTDMSFNDFYDDAYDGSNKDQKDIYKTNYNHVSVLASSSTSASYAPGMRYAIAVVPGGANGTDTVVAVWHDSIHGTLWYSYLENPIKNNHGNNVDSTTHVNKNWSKPIAILDKVSGGYCAIAVDPDKHVHIASYSKENTGSLVYTYLDTYNATYNYNMNSVFVDSYGATGQYITIDFAKSETSDRYVPYIGYLMTSLQYPKYAYLVDVESSGKNNNTWSPKPGSDNENMYTGAWESVILPTNNEFILDDINIGVLRNSDGTLKEIPVRTGTDICGGNGTKNPVLGYGINYAGQGYIETAQLK